MVDGWRWQQDGGGSRLAVWQGGRRVSLCLTLCVSLCISLCISHAVCLTVCLTLCVSLCTSHAVYLSRSPLCLTLCVPLCVPYPHAVSHKVLTEVQAKEDAVVTARDTLVREDKQRKLDAEEPAEFELSHGQRDTQGQEIWFHTETDLKAYARPIPAPKT